MANFMSDRYDALSPDYFESEWRRLEHHSMGRKKGTFYFLVAGCEKVECPLFRSLRRGDEDHDCDFAATTRTGQGAHFVHALDRS